MYVFFSNSISISVFIPVRLSMPRFRLVCLVTWRPRCIAMARRRTKQPVSPFWIRPENSTPHFSMVTCLPLCLSVVKVQRDLQHAEMWKML